MNNSNVLCKLYHFLYFCRYYHHKNKEMRKILYVLCLLTTLVACSDDDDKIITDYDKPYSKLPTSEFKNFDRRQY